EFHEAADLAAGVNVVADQPLGRGAAGLLGRGGEPALAEQRQRRVHVAAGLGEGPLALHHPRAGRVAELLHLISRDCHSRHCLSLQQVPLLSVRPCTQERRPIVQAGAANAGPEGPAAAYTEAGVVAASRGAGRVGRERRPERSSPSPPSSPPVAAAVPRPAGAAAAVVAAKSRIARSASPLPGMTKSTPSGSP